MFHVRLLALFLCSVLLPLGATAQTIQLPQTGQTTCYESYASGAPVGESGAPLANCTDTGQDGEHQAGMAWPDPRFTVTYCDGDGPCGSQDADCDANPSTDLVVDNLTGDPTTIPAKEAP